MEKVSVIMGIYNCEKTLDEAIQSIINQSYENLELIICDDYSTDQSYQIANSYAITYPEKVLLIKNEKNLKLAATLNHCLKYVTGDYIARMDGDDISVSSRIEKQVEFLRNNKEYDLVGTQMLSFDETGDIGIKAVRTNPDKYTLRFNTPFAHATILARKYVYDRLKGYRISKETTRCEDVDLWFRFFAEKFKGYNLPVPLYRVREAADDFKRRNIIHGLNTAKVCYRGYKSLNFPKKYYIYLLKPIIVSSLHPAFIKAIHNYKDKRRNSRFDYRS